VNGEQKSRTIPAWAVIAAAVGGAYGLRHLLASIGKQRVMRSAYDDLSPYELARHMKKLRAKSHPWISSSFEKVHIRSR
jgi:hypothetical protein